MKILTICDQWNNRSVHFAHPLKYWGNECISIWIKNTSTDTLTMLYYWADKVICTEKIQTELLLPKWKYEEKILLLDVGLDTYPRPFNKELHEKVKKLLEEHKLILKNT